MHWSIMTLKQRYAVSDGKEKLEKVLGGNYRPDYK